MLQALAGTGTAFFNPASTGLTPMTVSAERLQEANALRGMSMASMQFVGPALAGILIVTVGPGYALAIDAATKLPTRIIVSHTDDQRPSGAAIGLALAHKIPVSFIGQSSRVGRLQPADPDALARMVLR